MEFQEGQIGDRIETEISGQLSSFTGSSMSERDSTLLKELNGVKNLNKVIEKVIGGLLKAQKDMENVDEAVKDVDKLLEKWIKILNQTEHTQRLILNKKWHGATKDILDAENEALKMKEQGEEIKSLEGLEKKMKETKRELSNISYISNSDKMDNKRKAKQKEPTKTNIQNRKPFLTTNKM
ncbi:hypothetical protein T552_00699 [Pneumocystis carinii B80]|uniref:DASH complex subunit DUO1 n=1 Tax=Pneumocystis carinii (strain B80) TaxID=1408658 RepID=A0A0W4ZPE3_PNEC8|nr:hypothetical protein T552_00699 [Pneumocystis carinii B80]KTW30221.1 hypothetical protein T552_00699 [Pneumocystis carinii B80]